MALIQLKPPDSFNFRRPDDWPHWKRRFQQFRVASGLAGDTEAKQISTLLYCLGKEAEAVLTSTNITEADKQVYDSVMTKFDEFFQVRRNIIFERARFNRRAQLQGETVEQYIMELYQLSENCEYGEKTDEMIRDRLVVGISNSKLSERLQLDPALTLAKAKKMVRQQEAVHEQQAILKQGDTAQAEEIKSRSKSGGGKKATFGKKTKPNPANSTSKKCTRCGKESHPRERCPAKDAICNKCHKRGHYSAQCYSKLAAEVHVSGECILDTAFLDTLSNNPETSWFIQYSIG